MRRHAITQLRLAELVSACLKSPICIDVESDASVDDLFRTVVSRSYILPFSQEKPNEGRMERPWTEHRKGCFGKLLRDVEQRANADQGTEALLGVRAAPLCIDRQGRPVRSRRRDAKPHCRAYPGARPSWGRPDGRDHASAYRAVFPTPRRPRPRDTPGAARPTFSPALRTPGGDRRPDPGRTSRCDTRPPWR